MDGCEQIVPPTKRVKQANEIEILRPKGKGKKSSLEDDQA